MVIVSVAAHPIVNPLRPDVQRGCIFIGVFSLAKVKEYVGVSCFYVQREPCSAARSFLSPFWLSISVTIRIFPIFLSPKVNDPDMIIPRHLCLTSMDVPSFFLHMRKETGIVTEIPIIFQEKSKENLDILC